jgi:Family of unknown function (DUF6088)
MRTERLTPSIAATVRERVHASPPGTFLRRKDFAGSDRAVESELSRMVLAGELIRVRRGIYYRGMPTRFGMTRPSLIEAAIAVAGPGSGPAGISAAHMLGLTTQVPGTVEVAAAGKVPEAMAGVRFRLRPYGRRELGLTPVEVAVLEVLRDPGSTETTWPEVQARFADLIATSVIRATVLADEVADERHLGARGRWRELDLVA